MAERGASQIFLHGLLEGQICVVSGAGTGLGRATAIELASLGATVIGCGRRPEPIEETVRMIREAGGTAEVILNPEAPRTAHCGPSTWRSG